MIESSSNPIIFSIDFFDDLIKIEFPLMKQEWGRGERKEREFERKERRKNLPFIMRAIFT